MRGGGTGKPAGLLRARAVIQRGGGGQEIKLEGGDVVVAEGEQVVDEGDESGEGEGDEVQEQAHPPPRCYP